MKETCITFNIKCKYNLSLLSLFFISFLACIPFFSNRTFEITNYRDFFCAFSGNKILSLALFIFIFFLFKRYWKFFKIEKYDVKYKAFLSVCFSLSEVIGYSIDRYKKLFYPWFNGYILLFDLILFLGYFIIFYFMVSLIFYGFENLSQKLENNSTLFHEKYEYFSDNTKSIFFVVGILILSWSLYYIIFFPGVVTWDSYYQIEQGLRFVPLTDEHPFLHTLFQGFVISCGSKILGTINLGISVQSIIQMIFVAFVISYSLKTMAKYQIPPVVRIISLLFYSLHPLIGIYSVTLWKDIWLSTFILLYCSLLIDIFCDSEKFFKSKLKVFLFMLTILFIMLSKGTGIIYIVLSFIPLYFKLQKKYFFKSSIIYLLSFTVIFFIRVFLMPYLGIIKGHVREPMSVPIQQIARVVKEHGEDINDEQKIEINEILPFDRLPDLYSPTLSDNVKSEFNEKIFLSNPRKYAKLWIKLGLRYPKTYIESFLCNSYGYWYPEVKYWIVSSDSYIKMINFYKSNDWEIYDKDIERYPSNDLNFRNTTAEFINKYIREVPIISSLFSVAFYFWAELLAFAFLLKNRKNNIGVLFSIVFATFLGCIMSPVHAEMRYAYPAVLMFPLFLSFSLFKAKKL